MRSGLRQVDLLVLGRQGQEELLRLMRVEGQREEVAAEEGLLRLVQVEGLLE